MWLIFLHKGSRIDDERGLPPNFYSDVVKELVPDSVERESEHPMQGLCLAIAASDQLNQMKLNEYGTIFGRGGVAMQRSLLLQSPAGQSPAAK